ncbi:MAG: peroxiredoxin [Glaciecola sp.]|jgi:peroxiredoxin
MSAADFSSPLTPSEGVGVLHLFYAADAAVAHQLSEPAIRDTIAVLDEWSDEIQLHLFSVLGHKADIMIMALDKDLNKLRALQTDIAASGAGPALELSWSYLSLTETSEYTPTPEDQAKRFAAEGLEGDALAERIVKETQRLEQYNTKKLYPDMPAWELACFYPMSHRREGADNWYSLDYAERRRLMHEHGKSGRAYSGRVLQLVSGSTGLDDWEWGVTLFAHDISEIKDIVYTMRYDEASARYAEFGPFVIGLRRSPEALIADVGFFPPS